jgi:D-alanyl-D-alanine-carboxypeptidase/D-alanyl-D-alanine-endopeptidase
MILRIQRLGDRLISQATGQQPIPIFASAPNEFFVQVANITLSFQRDTRGQVTGLILHQHGDHLAPKISEAAASKVEGIEQINLSRADLHAYVGHYAVNANTAFMVTLEDDQLMVKLAAQPSIPVYARAKDHFFYRIVDAQIDFERDSAGKVIALVLHQNGKDIRAPRSSTP